jgi:hypothetical protein
MPQIFLIQSKPFLCKAKYLLPRHGLWHRKFQNLCTSYHPMCLELVLWILAIFDAISAIISMIVMANHEMQVCGLIDLGFVCIRFLIKCFIL